MMLHRPIISHYDNKSNKQKDFYVNKQILIEGNCIAPILRQANADQIGI